MVKCDQLIGNLKISLELKLNELQMQAHQLSSLSKLWDGPLDEYKERNDASRERFLE